MFTAWSKHRSSKSVVFLVVLKNKMQKQNNRKFLNELFNEITSKSEKSNITIKFWDSKMSKIFQQPHNSTYQTTVSSDNVCLHRFNTLTKNTLNYTIIQKTPTHKDNPEGAQGQQPQHTKYRHIGAYNFSLDRWRNILNGMSPYVRLEPCPQAIAGMLCHAIQSGGRAGLLYVFCW